MERLWGCAWGRSTTSRGLEDDVGADCGLGERGGWFHAGEMTGESKRRARILRGAEWENPKWILCNQQPPIKRRPGPGRYRDPPNSPFNSHNIQQKYTNTQKHVMPGRWSAQTPKSRPNSPSSRQASPLAWTPALQVPDPSSVYTALTAFRYCAPSLLRWQPPSSPAPSSSQHSWLWPRASTQSRPDQDDPRSIYRRQWLAQ